MNGKFYNKTGYKKDNQNTSIYTYIMLEVRRL